MKKIMLIFGIAIFSSVSAQQRDLFDINAHLQKKSAAGKKAAKKLSIPLPFRHHVIITAPSLTRRNLRSYTLPNGDKVIIADLDNMPCVQPDMQRFRVMPAIRPDIRQFRTMPNLSAQFIYFPGYVKADQLPALSRSFYGIME